MSDKFASCFKCAGTIYSYTVTPGDEDITAKCATCGAVEAFELLHPRVRGCSRAVEARLTIRGIQRAHERAQARIRRQVCEDNRANAEQDEAMARARQFRRRLAVGRGRL